MGRKDRFEAVLPAARAGAEWALSALYRDLHPSLLRYLRAQEPREAEDLASEVWVDVARNLGRFEGGEQDLRRWLFTIARRRLIDFRRRQARHPMILLPAEELPEEASASDVALEAIETLTARVAIERIVSVLSPDQAEVVLLRLVGGLSTGEIGSIMGKRAGTVRVLQHRALERLAREFAPAVTGRSGGAI
jgi:RNA polymerase sigma-70 factor (ECF subfamily)